jgi:peptidoglycan/LPS O-acetylase OafA/YrhL
MQIQSPAAYFILLPLLCLFAFFVNNVTGWARLETPRQASHQQYPGLDGLRGMLATNVFICHGVITYFYFRTGDWCPPSSNFYAQIGTLSVTMFFFITGFLFWSKLIKPEKGLSFVPLMRNRARRLLPGYYCSLFFVFALIGLNFKLPLKESTPMFVAQVGSWVACGLPFGFLPINKFIDTFRVSAGVFWTLQIEWAFYIVLPFLTWFGRKWRVVYLLAICEASYLLLSHVGAGNKILTRVFDLPLNLALYTFTCFSVGMLAAHAKKSRRWEPLLCHWLCTPIALVLWLVAVFAARPKFGLVVSGLLAPIFFMIVFGNDFHGLLSNQAMVFLGKISYSFYLLHGIVIYVSMQVVGWFVPVSSISAVRYWSLLAGIGVLVVIVSSVSYRFVEYPWMLQTPIDRSLQERL